MEMANSLVEIALLNSPSLSSRLLKVGYISEDNIVVGVYTDGGVIAGWNVGSSTVVFTHELGIVTPKALDFAASGKKLFGVMDHVFKSNDLNQNIEYLNGIALWDVRTGILLKCITYPCQNNSGKRDGFLGHAVDMDGKLDATFFEGLINISDLSNDTIILNHEINAIDAPYQWQIGSVAFDTHNHRYAVVFQEGRIYVSDIEKPLNYHVIAKGVKGDIVNIFDAQIDPTGRWLVVARGDKTSVLNLDNGKVLLEISTSNPKLAFDRLGEFLFVGSEDNLTIYSLEKASKTSEYAVNGITTIAVSEDNRLVIWGDVQGGIHIWASPLSK
jgi:WD40 repeat protein